MFKLKIRLYVITVMLSLMMSTMQVSANPDYARERKWADEITPFLVVGDPVYLTQKNQHKFLCIKTEADNARMAVVVVHGMGVHPDWGMIGTLRMQLAEEGYTTFSIQMPVLAAGADGKDYRSVFPDAVDRLKIAVAHLKKLDYKRIAIVSHSIGSRMTHAYMSNNPADVDAWVSISLTQGDNFNGIQAPILDLYGESDLPQVLSNATKRKASLMENKASRQILIPGGDHLFTGQEEAMIIAVKNFLDDVK